MQEAQSVVEVWQVAAVPTAPVPTTAGQVVVLMVEAEGDKEGPAGATEPELGREDLARQFKAGASRATKIWTMLLGAGRGS